VMRHPAPVSLLRLLVQRLLPRRPRPALADAPGRDVHARPPTRAAADRARPRESPRAACTQAMRHSDRDRLDVILEKGWPCWAAGRSPKRELGRES